MCKIHSTQLTKSTYFHRVRFWFDSLFLLTYSSASVDVVRIQEKTSIFSKNIMWNALKLVLLEYDVLAPTF